MIQYFAILIAVVSADEPKTPIPNPLPSGFYQIDNVPVSEDFKKALKDLSSSVGRVEIIARETNELVSVGTGYVKNPGDQAVTALHVVEDVTVHPDQFKAQLRLDSGEIIELSKVKKTDADRDYISFDLDQKREHFLNEIPNAVGQSGLKIFALGFPYGRPKHLSMGYALESSDQNKNLWMTSIASVPGMSGSPVIAFNASGKILGVIGNLHGTEWVRKLPNLPGAFLLQLGALDEINRRLLHLAEIEKPQEAVEAKKDGIGQWQSPQFEEWWQDTRAQPFVVTLHNLKISSDDLQKTEAQKFFDMVLDSLAETKMNVQKSKKVSEVRSTLETAFANINEISIKFLKTRLSGYQVIIDVPLLTKSELSELVSSVNDVKDAERILKKWIEEFDAAKKGVNEKFEAVSKFVKFLDPSIEILKWFLEGDAKKELENPSKFLSDKQFRLPGYISLNP